MSTNDASNNNEFSGTTVTEDHSRTREITVIVNEQPVAFQVHETTGLGIKKNAIQQGVPIAVDFSLFEILDHDRLKPIDDDDPVKLHPHQRFRAVAPDDNS